MEPLLRYALIGALLLIPPCAQAQRGPGGVSIEESGWSSVFTPLLPPGQQSSCRLWLDAGSLTTLGDGDYISTWVDQSPSYIQDVAELLVDGLSPYFRNDPAYAINGYPVITFEENRFFQMVSSVDLNSNTITTGKTVFFAFRTSVDVNTTQMIYEEGGCSRGLNAYIDNGMVYLGAYDLNENGINNTGAGGPNGNGTDADNTPQWGYTFVSRPIQANTTYILVLQYSAPTPGAIHTSHPDFYIRGWLNGEEFATMDFTSANGTNTTGSNTGINGIGALWRHTNPIGIGAVHSGVIYRTGINCNATGQMSFQGRLAEICYYDQAISPTARIIVTNYLASKYLSLSLVDDRYAHKQSYGAGVIGIGQETNSATNRHLRSQGLNPFEISVQDAALTAPDRYFLTGHNKAALQWTDNQVAGSPANMRRLLRTWRADRTNWATGAITFKVNAADLPALPTGFQKVVLMVDETSANFPNFALASTKVLEMHTTDNVNFTLTYDLPDNAFFTIGTVRPEISFSQPTASAVEGNPPGSTPASVQVQLNFTPHAAAASGFTAHYLFDPVTATLGDDFTYDAAAQAAGVTIPSGQRFGNIPFEIVRDLDQETPATETIDIVLLPTGTNHTPGLQIGTRDTLTFFIYDDDAPPIAIFDPVAINQLENEPGAQLTVTRVGNADVINTTTSVVRVRLKNAPNNGTATYGVDYTLINAEGWFNHSGSRAIFLTFPPGETTQTAFVSFLDDETDEYDETINFELQPISGFNLGAPETREATITIVDNDPLPVVSFVTNNQQGFSSIGTPIIFVQLDRPSAKDVQVDYSILAVSSAASGTHYNISLAPPTIIFPPDSTLMWPPLFVEGDSGDSLESRTVVFELVPDPVNATLGSPLNHTYTIVNYAPFEWRGAAGVGRDSDNIIWLDADRMSGSHGEVLQSLTNFSPRTINVVQNDVLRQARLQTEVSANLINSRHTFLFDGNDMYSVQKHPSVNQSGSFQKKAFFFVVKTGSVTGRQVLYQQGVSNRGITIYLESGRFYINAWNTVNNSENTAWGAGSGQRYAFSHPVTANTNYIISAHFDHEAPEKIVIYVNGRKGDRIETGNCGVLFGDDSDVGLGGILGIAKFHTGAANVTSGNHFTGYLAEFIKFSDHQLNETRRCIVENYLSAKYNIPLTVNTVQLFATSFADKNNVGNYFGDQMAGIGVGVNENTDVHLDAQGLSELRINKPKHIGLNSLMVWGHNGVPLNHSWPYSNAVLPAGIYQRSGRVWKVFKQGVIDSVDVTLRFTNLENAPLFAAGDLKLLIHTNAEPQNFSNATVVSGNAALNQGFIVQFSNVSIPHGAYMALASTSTSMLPLPIELVHFTAKIERDRVRLSWQTASETNNDYFTVERTGNNIHWETVLHKPGAGNSSHAQHYSDWDDSPLEGWSYYRLKQTDFNGKFSYSDPQAVWYLPEEGEGSVFLFPNPASRGAVYIRLPGFMQRAGAMVSLYDLSGKAILQREIAADIDIYELQFGSIQAGIYAVVVQSGSVTEVQKLVVQR